MFDKETPDILPRSKSLVVCNQKATRPTMWKVVLQHDEYTPPNFVRNLLTDEFHRSAKAAFEMTMAFRQKGRVFAGAYTWEAAESKADYVRDLARHGQHPLLITLERV